MADPVVPTPAAPPPAAAPPAPAKDDAAFAALAAKEKAFVAERTKFSTEKEALKADRERLTAEAADYQRWKLAKAQRLVNPEPYLKEDFGEGWYDKLTEYKLAGAKPTPEFVAASVDEKLAAFEARQKAERDAQAKADADAATAARAEAWEKFQADTSEFVKAQPDDYELINLYDAHARVIAVVVETYEKTGRVLQAKEAADLVEADLLERSNKSKKLKATPPPAVLGAEKRSESAQPRTLTNAQGAVTTPPHQSILTEDQRIQAAIAKGKAAQQARLQRA